MATSRGRDGSCGVPSARAPRGQRLGGAVPGSRRRGLRASSRVKPKEPLRIAIGGILPSWPRWSMAATARARLRFEESSTGSGSTPCSTAMADVAEVARNEKIRAAIVVVLWEGERRARARAVVVRLVDIGVGDTCYDMQPWISPIARSSFFEG